MTRWVDIYNVTAEYVSDVVDATSDFDFYVTEFSHKYANNDGVITLKMRVTNDNGDTWNDWVDITNGIPFDFFDGDGFKLNETKFQYKIILDLSMKLNGKSPIFDLFKLNVIGTHKIRNDGDEICKPELWVKKVNGSGDIKLINETNGQELILTNLNDGEVVYIDCENEDIVTDLPMKYRYNDHNDVFLQLEIGDNMLAGEGDFELSMRMQFKTLQG